MNLLLKVESADRVEVFFVGSTGFEDIRQAIWRHLAQRGHYGRVFALVRNPPWLWSNCRINDDPRQNASAYDYAARCTVLVRAMLQGFGPTTDPEAIIRAAAEATEPVDGSDLILAVAEGSS